MAACGPGLAGKKEKKRKKGGKERSGPDWAQEKKRKKRKNRKKGRKEGRERGMERRKIKIDKNKIKIEKVFRVIVF